MRETIVVMGGGAAGFFGAITCAENNPTAQVILLEKTAKLLSKVRVSGGGRCNVTHQCFAGHESGRPGGLEVKTAGYAIHVQDFAGQE